MKAMKQTPLDRLRHHVTGAIERGEAEAIVEQRVAPPVAEQERIMRGFLDSVRCLCKHVAWHHEKGEGACLHCDCQQYRPALVETDNAAPEQATARPVGPPTATEQLLNIKTAMLESAEQEVDELTLLLREAYIQFEHNGEESDSDKEVLDRIAAALSGQPTVNAYNDLQQVVEALRELMTAAKGLDDGLHAGRKVAQLSTEQSRVYNAINNARAALASLEKGQASD